MSAAKQEVAISISWLIFRVVLQLGDRQVFFYRKSYLFRNLSSKSAAFAGQIRLKHTLHNLSAASWVSYKLDEMTVRGDFGR